MSNNMPPIPSREELGRIVDQAMMGRPCWNEKVCNAGEAVIEACGIKIYQERIAELEAELANLKASRTTKQNSLF